MAKTFISPSKYIQGAGEIKNLGAYTKKWGKKSLVILSKGGEKRFGDTVKPRRKSTELLRLLKTIIRR